MKVTICTGPIFPVPAVRGGSVHRLWEGLAREFAGRGHQVAVFAREFPGQAKEDLIDGVRYVRRGGYPQSTSINRDLARCLVYALRTARHVPRADIVVTNDFWTPAVLPLFRPNVGRVVVNANRFPKRQYRLYRKAAAFAAASKAVADAIIAQAPSARSKTQVVPNAVDRAFFSAPRPKTAAGKIRLLYAGRIHPEKGLETLGQALRMLGARSADWECMLVGPVAREEGGGGDGYAKAIASLTENLPVRLCAPVYEPAQLARIYDEADIFVYPSVAETGESFGIAPLEAMARGVVPVVSGLAVFRDYLEPEVNGMIFDHKAATPAENLADVLRGLVVDPAKRKRLGDSARSKAESFTPAAIADKYLRLFESLLPKART